MKVVINVKHGGFGLSEAAYEWLIKRGVPVRAYIKQERDEDGRYKPQSLNEGKVIFDRNLDCNESDLSKSLRKFSGSRYWEMWIEKDRAWPMLVQLVEDLGDAANGSCAKLKVVEIPDEVKWTVEEYDGLEWVAEQHRTWK